MGSRVYRVPEVSCSHCVSAIEEAVSKVGGVTGVQVDLEQKTVAVGGDFAEPDVITAIEDAGYEVAAA